MDLGAGTRVEVNREECTGCGLCVGSCERRALRIGTASNHYGVFPVQQEGEVCKGCGTCYYLCPEPGAITLYN
jgi:2-oxoglutarate ferredoxin oxidoreductase subunit delta